MVLDTAWALRWMKLASVAMARERDVLTELDRAIGDGDHGENMERGFKAVEAQLAHLDETQSVGDVLKTVARLLMTSVGGAAGPLFGTAFLRASRALPDHVVTTEQLSAAMQAALQGIQARGHAMPGEKTMVDAWAGALQAAQSGVAHGDDAETVLANVAHAARAGADRTRDMVATKGRASYLGERSVGHLDPGAVSSAILLEEAAAAAGGAQ